jgi:uncharacterized RDD family membrane protein YckC
MNQITILNDANQPMGPFTRDEVNAKLQAGEVRLTSLAFVEGLQQWTPLRDVLARVDAAAAPPPVASPSISPPSAVPSGFVPGYAPAPAPAVTGYSYAASMQPPSHLVYAGFWLRFAAIIVDGIIFLPLSIVSYLLQSAANHVDEPSAKILLGLFMICYGIFEIVARWLYFALMESSSWQATLGKRLLGIRVTSLDGQRIGFGRATGRYFGKILSALILFVGFIMAGLTERKQALHDMLAGTLVVRG